MSHLAIVERKATAEFLSCTISFPPCSRSAMQLGDEPDEVLARRAAYDAAAMTELYRRYRPPIERFCRMKIAYPDNALDVVQDVFVKVLIGLQKNNVIESFRNWIYTIARNEVINFYRSNKHDIPIDDTFDRPTDDPSPEDEALLQDDLAWVRRIMPKILTRDEQEVVELRMLEMANPEIAALLNRTYSWVGSTYHRAIKKLKAEWDRQNGKGGTA